MVVIQVQPLQLTETTQSKSWHLSSRPALSKASGGNDTMYVGSSVFGGSSIYGGQGVDLDLIVGTVTGSTVGGNLGNDTLEFSKVVKGAAIYGGGGFEYDTSLDGADSISIGAPSSVQVLWSRPMAAMTPSTSVATSLVPPCTAAKARLHSWCRLPPLNPSQVLCSQATGATTRLSSPAPTRSTTPRSTVLTRLEPWLEMILWLSPVTPLRLPPFMAAPVQTPFCW